MKNLKNKKKIYEIEKYRKEKIKIGDIYYLNNIKHYFKKYPGNRKEYSLITDQWAKKSLFLLDSLFKICNKYNVDLWAGGGTLIGSIRHDGFIPWDDDMDVFSQYKFKKFFLGKLFKDELNSYGLDTLVKRTRYIIKIFIKNEPYHIDLLLKKKMVKNYILLLMNGVFIINLK